MLSLASLGLGNIAFAAPWLLVALPALPLLYWLLRVTPPAPRRLSFPPMALLKGLPPAEETSARTPWWLLLLRLLAAAALIIGLARPVLAPQPAAGSGGPLLLALDNGWAAAPDWPQRQAAAMAALNTAAREDRPTALLATAPPETGEPMQVIGPMPARDLQARLTALHPEPWAPDRVAALSAVQSWTATHPARGSMLYITDGIQAGPAAGAATGFQRLAEALAQHGPLSLARNSAAPVRLLQLPLPKAEGLELRLATTPQPVASQAEILARSADGRALAASTLQIPAGATSASALLQLPLEIRNEVTALELRPAGGGAPGAGGVVLLDEGFRRRPVGLVAGVAQGADAPLIGELFYLERALGPQAELRRGSIQSLIAQPLSVLILADREVPAGPEQMALARWVERGGTLIRFAGPHVAENPDALLPVPLRTARSLGGALSWEKPQHLAPFPDASPFAGLPVPSDVQVHRQVLAEPGPELPGKIWAALTDGTPLVTASPLGRGRVVLFHVTANADWSDLPLSGLFPQMLDRLVALAAGVPAGEAQGGEQLSPLETLDGLGRLGPPPPVAAPAAANSLAHALPSPQHPPGWYGRPGENSEARRALNLAAATLAPEALGPAPAGSQEITLGAAQQEREFGPWLLAAALAVLVIDLLLSLRLRGLMSMQPGAARPERRTLLLAAGVGLAGALWAAPGFAQTSWPPTPMPTTPMPTVPMQGRGSGASENPALATHLAYVVTGDAETDTILRQGLSGLSDFVNQRSAAQLAAPIGVVPGQDDLSYYPLLYWVVLPDTPAPGPAAVAALNNFMSQGGVILLDTRDAGSGEGMHPGADAALQRITQGLAIPPLAPVPEDHVLRRAFYLLQDFPGRYAGGQVWVSRDQDRANDSVSPVIIGGNDWAAAWAVDENGRTPYATIPGGARQRVMAYRFGMNLVMYALTGNYKGDQVHVPAILERLGN